MLKIIIPIAPRTKKNSQRIVNIKIKGTNKYRPIIMPSELYEQYEKDCKKYLPKLKEPISEKVNVKCLYYMPTRRRCDLNNLLEASTDMLVHHKILKDDNYSIVNSHDGSRVYYDKENPRCEIYIEKIDY
jgi:Holliday junction resolvase RusA-like endonuclease